MATETETKKTTTYYYTIPIEVPELPDFDSLPDEDGENLESDWHRLAMNLLIELVYWLFQGRNDYYVGGNMFIYYTAEQFKGLRVRGPDFFFVRGVDREPTRGKWIVMKEWGKYPDVIMELLSPTTANVDMTTKKTLYEQTFRTREYFCYDPATRKLYGWHLVDGKYQDITPNERGWLFCNELNVWVGTWSGKHPITGLEDVWLRFYHTDEELVPTFAEAATKREEAERTLREEEQHRANKAEAEVERLRALLLDKDSKPRPNGGQAGQ
jgi:Uma2 family endonuclease